MVSPDVIQQPALETLPLPPTPQASTYDGPPSRSQNHNHGPSNSAIGSGIGHDVSVHHSEHDSRIQVTLPVDTSRPRGLETPAHDSRIHVTIPPRSESPSTFSTEFVPPRGGQLELLHRVTGDPRTEVAGERAVADPETTPQQKILEVEFSDSRKSSHNHAHGVPGSPASVKAIFDNKQSEITSNFLPLARSNDVPAKSDRPRPAEFEINYPPSVINTTLKDSEIPVSSKLHPASNPNIPSDRVAPLPPPGHGVPPQPSANFIRPVSKALDVDPSGRVINASLGDGRNVPAAELDSMSNPAIKASAPAGQGAGSASSTPALPMVPQDNKTFQLSFPGQIINKSLSDWTGLAPGEKLDSASIPSGRSGGLALLPPLPKDNSIWHKQPQTAFELGPHPVITTSLGDLKKTAASNEPISVTAGSLGRDADGAGHVASMIPSQEAAEAESGPRIERAVLQESQPSLLGQSARTTAAITGKPSTLELPVFAANDETSDMPKVRLVPPRSEHVKLRLPGRVIHALVVSRKDLPARDEDLSPNGVSVELVPLAPVVFD
jgi:hypothetical protein